MSGEAKSTATKREATLALGVEAAVPAVLGADEWEPALGG